MNFVRLIFILCGLYVGIVGLIIDFLEPYVPCVISRMYRFGKFGITTKAPLVAKLEVPKRFFTHYYLFGAPMCTLTFLLAMKTYFYGGNLPDIIYQILDYAFGESRKAMISPEDSLLCIILLGIQVWKRLYECICVNVFSDKAIGLSHYLVGYVHYFLLTLCLIGESKGFIKGSTAVFHWDRITLSHIILSLTFLWASYQQLRSNVILANLRKNRNGKVITNEYKIPHGELFEYITAPLQFTEIILYVTLSIILWKYSVTFHYATLWVIINQVQCALLSHWWYHENFKDYPKTRKILFPYVF